ncbi:MAG: FliO/MopB family protein [Planctomycetota bacterium]
MAKYKKKVVVFLAAVTLCGGALVLCRAQSAPAERAKPLFDSTGSLFAKDPNLLTKPPDNLNTRELFFKMMLAVLLVIVLGVAAVYTSKKLLPKITNLSGREIHVIETVHLGPRKAVHLLKIGNQRLLIGSTSECITKLADVTAAPEHNKTHLASSDVFSEMDLPSQQTDNMRI